MWHNMFDTGPVGNAPDRAHHDADIGRLLAVAVAAAGIAAVATTLPLALVAPILRELLGLAAWGALGLAVLRRDEPAAARITAWDQAAILLFLSLLSGLFIDPGAARQALDLMTGAAAGAPA